MSTTQSRLLLRLSKGRPKQTTFPYRRLNRPQLDNLGARECWMKYSNRTETTNLTQTSFWVNISRSVSFRSLGRPSNTAIQYV